MVLGCRCCCTRNEFDAASPRGSSGIGKGGEYGREDDDLDVRERAVPCHGWPFRVVDADGGEFPAEKETIALCRCGASTNKPFCDGTHSKVGFRAAERAVE
jgi:CDGSH-type Zn-finger protein